MIGCVSLTVLPFLMNAFPTRFANAFSEHRNAWSFTSVLIMTGVLALWSWALVRLGGAWRRFAAFKVPTSVAVASGASSGSRLAWHFDGWIRWVLLLQGPILVGLFYLMWVVARISLGRWPHMGGLDDPKSVAGTNIVYWTICVWFWFGVPALAFPLVRAGSALVHGRGFARPVTEFALTAALLFGAFAYLGQDPQRLLTWFFD